MAAKKTAKKAAPAKEGSAPKAPAKKAATKAAKTATKAPAKKAEKAAPAAAPAKKTAAAKPPLDALARAAYLNYRRRVEQGLPGDSHGDWLEAERKFSDG